MLQHTAANLTSTSNAGQQPQPEASPASAASSATTSASVTSTASNQSDTMFTNNPELEPVTAWITFWDFFGSDSVKNHHKSSQNVFCVCQEEKIVLYVVEDDNIRLGTAEFYF